MSMQELIERLEKATGPDREIDARIHFTTLPNPDTCQFPTADVWAAEAVRANWNVPRYTSSIDAALTLVPEGWCWDVDYRPYARVWRTPQSDAHRGFTKNFELKQPAVALCIAALKARSQDLGRNQA